MNQKGLITIVLAIVAVIAVAAGARYFVVRKSPSLPLQTDIGEPKTSISPPTQSTSSQVKAEIKPAQKEVTQPRPPTSTSMIKVLSPNGGEVYHIGDTILITSSGGRRSDTGPIENGYFLVDSAGNFKEISYAGNSYQWTITTNRDGTAITPGRYKIRVTSSFGPCADAACAQTIEDESDSFFTITK